MHLHWDFFGLLMLGLILGTSAQSSFYQRSYFSPITSPSPSRFYRSNDGFMPIAYGASDLIPGETKRRETVQRYPANLIPFPSHSSEEEDSSRESYTSGEYSNEAVGYASNSKENDSREYSIGTHIRVQHPITVPKKKKTTSSSTSSHSHKNSRYNKHKPSSSYSSDVNYSTEIVHGNSHLTDLLTAPPTKKHTHKYTQVYEADPFHVVAPPKTSASSTHSSYSVYEPELEDYESTRHSSSTSGRTKSSSSSSHDRYKDVATKKQIQAFLKDQKKLIDEALKTQLLTNTDYQKYLKSKAKDVYDEEVFDGSSAPPHYRPNFDENLTFKPNRPRRRPPPKELKRSPKSGPLKPRRRFRPLVLSV